MAQMSPFSSTSFMLVSVYATGTLAKERITNAAPRASPATCTRGAMNDRFDVTEIKRKVGAIRN